VNKSLSAIMVIAVLGVGFLGIAAHMLTDSSPKVRVKVAVEREVPRVRVRAIETTVLQEPHRVLQRVQIEPRDAAVVLTLDDLEEVAMHAAWTMGSADLPIPIACDALAVAAPGDLALPERSRDEVLARANLAAELRGMGDELSQEWGIAPPRLRILGDRQAYGVALPARPPIDATDERIASALFRRSPTVRFVEVPTRTAGTAAPVRVERPLRR